MSDTENGGLISKVIGPKKRWREYKARVRQLPDEYRTAVEAIQRYLMYFSRAGDGDSASSMFEDLADLFEEAAVSGTSVRAVVGDDPVEFVETFLENYSNGGWVSRERNRLIASIASTDEGGTRA